MIFRTVTSQIFVACFFLFNLHLAGCTTSTTPAAAALRAGQAPFQFEVKAVKTVEIAQADTKTGESWTARLRRLDDGQWEIASAPGGADPLDRKAHSTLIDHILDSFMTLRIKALAPKGPLESFQLAPPHLAIRWNNTELRLGSGNYAAIQGTVYEMEGSALKLLEYIENFRSLRQQTWLYPLIPDDVDEIEIFSGNKKFYAQREGATWTDLHHKVLQKNLTPFLEELTHLRIQEFIDDANESARITEALHQAPLRRLVLKDRQGKPTEIRMGWVKPKNTTSSADSLLGIASSRANTPFRLYSESARIFLGL